MDHNRQKEDASQAPGLNETTSLPQQPPDDICRPTIGARRKRNEQGKRLRQNGRLKKLLAAAVAPIVLATTTLADAWWREAGLWAIDTSNANCFDTAHTNILGRSKADIVMVQEHRLKTSSEAATATKRARTAG